MDSATRRRVYDVIVDGLPFKTEPYAGCVSAIIDALTAAGLSVIDASKEWAAPNELTGRMWSVARKTFEDRARDYAAADQYEIASAIADRAPELIFEAMRTAHLSGKLNEELKQ